MDVERSKSCLPSIPNDRRMACRSTIRSSSRSSRVIVYTYNIYVLLRVYTSVGGLLWVPPLFCCYNTYKSCLFSFQAIGNDIYFLLLLLLFGMMLLLADVEPIIMRSPFDVVRSPFVLSDRYDRVTHFHTHISRTAHKSNQMTSTAQTIQPYIVPWKERKTHQSVSLV